MLNLGKSGKTIQKTSPSAIIMLTTYGTSAPQQPTAQLIALQNKRNSRNKCRKRTQHNEFCCVNLRRCTVYCLLKLQTYGFIVSILLLFIFGWLFAIQILGTLFRTWAFLRGTLKQSITWALKKLFTKIKLCVVHSYKYADLYYILRYTLPM